VRQVDDLESAGETFAQAPLHQERSGAEEHDPQREVDGRVFVPEPLDGLGPAGRLVNLVKGKHRAAAARVAGSDARGIPLLRDPTAAAQGRLVSRDIGGRNTERRHHLAHQRGLSHLARAGNDLYESPRLG